MGDVVIRVEGLGKKYRISHQRKERYTALRDVIADKVRSVFSGGRNSGGDVVNLNNQTDMEAAPGKDVSDDKFNFSKDPGAPSSASVEDFWALRDVSFEVKRGEVVGIIGRNGAGKSTLLKILSRITEPTEGRVELDGRVASLLEVGTGFHPELTGRENIFLNGAILGMTRAETRRKFDEIVAFAEVEKFLDTPVKRYSSGMYVRLAFAVAAHLDPEILIVDEVLAVGDLEFQRKCLGKMKDVSQHGGRTVLFVSHNIAAVKALCTKGLYLDRGRMESWGSIDGAVTEYLHVGAVAAFAGSIPDDFPRQISTGEAKIRRVHIVDSLANPVQTVFTGEPINIRVRWEVHELIEQGMVEIGIVDADGRQVTQSLSCDGGGPSIPMAPGLYEIGLRIDDIVFPGRYSLLVGVHKMDGATIDFIERALDFEVLNTGKGDTNHYPSKVRGYLRPGQQWQALSRPEPDQGGMQ